jgi:hypothetical protein
VLVLDLGNVIGLNQTKAVETTLAGLLQSIWMLQLLSTHVDLIEDFTFGGILNGQEEISHTVSIEVDHGNRVRSSKLWCSYLTLGSSTIFINHSISKRANIISPSCDIEYGYIQPTLPIDWVLIIEDNVIDLVSVDVTYEWL